MERLMQDDGLVREAAMLEKILNLGKGGRSVS